MIEHTVTSRSLKHMLRTLRVLSCTSPWKCWVGIFPFLDFVDELISAGTIFIDVSKSPLFFHWSLISVEVVLGSTSDIF